MKRTVFGLLAVLSIGIAGTALAQNAETVTPVEQTQAVQAAEPVQTAQAQARTTPVSYDGDMPETASPLPLLGLIGIAALLLGGTIGLVSRRRPEQRS